MKYDRLKEALVHTYGPGLLVTEYRRLSGGDINEAYCLTLSDGERVFLKTNSPKMADMFPAEAEGLLAMHLTGTIGIPNVLGFGICSDFEEVTGASSYAFGREGQEKAFLLLEYVEPGTKREDFWEVFGQELAELHRADTKPFLPGAERTDAGLFGFSVDNFIGSTPQRNTPMSSWVDFFRECRLEPQFKLAYSNFGTTEKRQFDNILNRLENLLPEPEFPSLLHGDLWGGNYLVGPDGKAWLMDPATYVGHREADLAMTELFGGFSPRFYAAYNEAAPVDPDYRDRRDLYNLYHLLNHLNLFGNSYYGSVCRILKQYA